MTARPADWSVFGLTSDPIPGDPVAAGISADTFQRNAEAVARARDNLQRLDTSSNESVALDKVKEQIRKVAADLEKVQSRVEGAAKALKDYSPLLEGAQSESAAALEEAIQAKATQRSHKNQVATLRDRVKTTADPLEAETLADEVRREQAAVDSAGSSLAAAQTRLTNAINARNEAASDAMTHLDKVAAGSQIKEGVLDKIVHQVAKVVTAVVEFSKAAFEHLDTIAMILTVVGLVLTFIPPLTVLGAVLLGAGRLLGTISTVISAVTVGLQLYGTLLAVMEGKVTLEQVGGLVGGLAIGFLVGWALQKGTGSLGKKFAKGFGKKFLKGGNFYNKLPNRIQSQIGKQMVVFKLKPGGKRPSKMLFPVDFSRQQLTRNVRISTLPEVAHVIGDVAEKAGTKSIEFVTGRVGGNALAENLKDGMSVSFSAPGVVR